MNDGEEAVRRNCKTILSGLESGTASLKTPVQNSKTLRSTTITKALALYLHYILGQGEESYHSSLRRFAQPSDM